MYAIWMVGTTLRLLAPGPAPAHTHAHAPAHAPLVLVMVVYSGHSVKPPMVLPVAQGAPERPAVVVGDGGGHLGDQLVVGRLVLVAGGVAQAAGGGVGWGGVGVGWVACGSGCMEGGE